MLSVTMNIKSRKVLHGLSRFRISVHSEHFTNLPKVSWSVISRSTVHRTAESGNRSFMWPYHARDTKCRKMSCWILHTSISRKWDTENPVSRCLFTPIMTRRIPIFILSLREWHLMEERFSTAMNADAPRKSLTVFLGMTGKRKRKMILMLPNNIYSLLLPSSRQ